MTTIPPDDPNIVSSPGTWDIDGTRAATINSGAYRRVLFSAEELTSIELTFDLTGVDTSPAPPTIDYRVDGGPWTREPIASTVDLGIPSWGLLWPKHLVEFIVTAVENPTDRWSTDDAKVKHTGMVTDVDAETEEIPTRTRRALVFGDSITEGARNLGLAGDAIEQENARLGFAYQLGELLNAEMGTIGFSGSGWLDPGNSGVPKLIDVMPVLWGGGPSRTLSGYDLILFAHGTNDFSQDQEEVLAEVIDCLNFALNSADDSTVIACMRPLNGAIAGTIVSGIAQCDNPDRVTYIDTNGWWTTDDSSDGLHPYAYSHSSVAIRMSDAIQQILEPGAGSSREIFTYSGWVSV